MLDLNLTGKRVLVCGASAGIGYGIAKSLCAQGARVVLAARSEDRLKAAALELGAVGYVVADFSKPGQGTHAVTIAQEKLGGALHVLVTNTGGPPKGAFETLSNEDWLQGFQGLWIAATEAIRAALPGMRQQQYGRVILVTSSAAKEPIKGLTVSNGLRAGLAGLTKSLADEVAVHGITVNCILPGYTNTDRLRQLGHSLDKVIAETPTGKLIDPEELGAMAAFLASPHARSVVGQSILIDGGRSHSF